MNSSEIEQKLAEVRGTTMAAYALAQAIATALPKEQQLEISGVLEELLGVGMPVFAGYEPLAQQTGMRRLTETIQLLRTPAP